MLNPNASAYQARIEALKLAFGPMMFQAAIVARDCGLLACIAARTEPTGFQELVEHTGKSPYAVRVLLDSSYATGLVDYDIPTDTCTLSKTGHFWLNDKLTRVNADFVQHVCYKGMAELEKALDTGTPAGLKVFGDWPTIYQGLSQLPDQAQQAWLAFDHFYSDTAFPHALPIVFEQPVQRLLDVGGNTGQWAIACCKHNPTVRITIADLPQQIDMAMPRIAEAAFADRVDACPVNLLDDNAQLPAGYDAIWMSQFLVCFPEDQITAILKRAAAAMGPDSRLYIMDTFWDRQEYPIAAYCLLGSSLYFTAMANGTSRVYRAEDFIRCAEQAGLEVTRQIDHLAVSHTLLICQKTDT